jgi:hypothetical protein
MRLKITQAEIHTDLVAAAGWALTNELYTCSDDKSICKWQMTGEAGGKVAPRPPTTRRSSVTQWIDVNRSVGL